MYTRETLLEVIDYAGTDLTYTQLQKMIKAEAVDDTELFRVVVTSSDSAQAAKLANAIAYILPKRISGIVEGTSAKVVDAAVVSSRPSSPDYLQNTVIGFVAGLVLAAVVIALRELFDTAIHSKEDIEQVCKQPILAAVPDMSAPSTGGYCGSRKENGANAQEKPLLGAYISRSASEAYKLLRTKLQYSFADEGNCRVIGISSALPGEGKSLTAVNLAYSLSQLNKRVLLIECDMRCPSLAEKLPVSGKHGLSGFLSGQNHVENLIQLCGLRDNEKAFHVITAGQNPPNPVELLSSARMEKLLRKLRGLYDYVLLDLPPVAEVSDVLAVAKHTDGMLMVVRQNCCNRHALHTAAQQLEFVECRLLGVVYNCAADSFSEYYKTYYHIEEDEDREASC